MSMERDLPPKNGPGIAEIPESDPASEPSPGSAVRVRKLRPDGSERFAWTGAVLHADRSGVIVRAEYDRPQLELGYTTFRTGDVFVEFYFWGRWYSVAQLFAADGTLKGWYCDVCMPPRWDAPGELSYVDLALDLWMGADGAIVLLDEQEFAEYRAAGIFTPAQAEGAERGWAELRALAERGQLPRRPCPTLVSLRAGATTVGIDRVGGGLSGAGAPLIDHVGVDASGASRSVAPDP